LLDCGSFRHCNDAIPDPPAFRSTCRSYSDKLGRINDFMLKGVGRE